MSTVGVSLFAGGNFGINNYYVTFAAVKYTYHYDILVCATHPHWWWPKSGAGGIGCAESACSEMGGSIMILVCDQSCDFRASAEILAGQEVKQLITLQSSVLIK